MYFYLCVYTCKNKYIIYHIRTILTIAWTLGSCVKQHCEVDLSIPLLATWSLLFEIDKICRANELCIHNQCINVFHLRPASFFTCFEARKIVTSYRKSKVLLKWFSILHKRSSIMSVYAYLQHMVYIVFHCY